VKAVSKVQLGVYVRNIDSVDTRLGTWVGEIMLYTNYSQADFRGDTPKVSINADRVVSVTKAQHNLPGGVVQAVQHLHAGMYFRGSFELFPFDTQILYVNVVLGESSPSDVLLEQWADKTDIASQVKTNQFRVASWAVQFAAPSDSSSMSCITSCAYMKISVERSHSGYYYFNCIGIPFVIVTFALVALFLPLQPITPRIMISFISFLGLSGHIKWILTLMPPGTISWMLADMLFLEAILCSIIFGNVVVYRLFLISETEARNLDLAVRSLLLTALLLGQTLLICFYRASWPLLWVMLGSMFFLHASFVLWFYAAAASFEDDESETDSGRRDLDRKTYEMVSQREFHIGVCDGAGDVGDVGDAVF